MSAIAFTIHTLAPPDDALVRARLDMFGVAFDDVPTYSAAQPRAAYLARLLDSDTFGGSQRR